MSGTLEYARRCVPGRERSDALASCCAHADPSDLIIHAGRLFFSADDGVHGRELWAYESGRGASLFKDLNPGVEGS